MRLFVGLWILASVLLVGCTEPRDTQGFAGLGALAASAEGFAQASPERSLRFPADHGAHPGYRIEWWYLTANLTDAEGQRYGVQWTLFRSAQSPPSEASGNPWHDPQIYMAHFAISTETDHVAFQRYARGGIHGEGTDEGVARAGAKASPFSVWLDDWSMTTAATTTWAPIVLTAAESGYAVDLQLETERPPLLQGIDGFSQKHPNGGGSHYYSQPFLKARGSIVIDGTTIEVSGHAWLDREWSSQFLQPDQSGWDWFAIHLDSGEKLMLFQLRSQSSGGYRHGVLIHPDGVKQPLVQQDIEFVPEVVTEVAGRLVPTTWTVKLPELGRTLSVSALQPEQWMDVDFAYWEGPVVITGDSPGESGVGYLEMVGY